MRIYDQKHTSAHVLDVAELYAYRCGRLGT